MHMAPIMKTVILISARLPDNPDMEKVAAYVERINRYVVTGELV